jgi:hypothetical protein
MNINDEKENRVIVEEKIAKWNPLRSRGKLD